MAEPKLVEILRQGSEVWNRWYKQQHDFLHIDLDGSDLNYANLSNIDLSNVNLHNANLSEANLSEANLRHTNLSEANLRHADLGGADLSYANLIKTDLWEADLSFANLSFAKLDHADLRETNLSGTDLREANLAATNIRGAFTWKGTIFANVDLREVHGLAEIDHRGPSRVELYTIQLPSDGSALHFLRGTGVPDEWIDFYRAQMMHPIQYHSCFISYSSKDEMLARRLHADLQAQGVRCWFAPEDMKIGDKLRSRIDEAIHLQDKLLLLLSEHALASGWIEDEIDIAFTKEREQKREVLFPVRLDDAVMETRLAWAKKLRDTRHIGDFTNWTDPQSYQQAFERLLRDLKKADEQKLEDGGN